MKTDTKFSVSPLTFGICCCALAAVSYSMSNICLKHLSSLNADPAWVICIKELVATFFAGMWLLGRAIRKLPTFPPPKTLGMLILVGLAVQLIGNVGLLWAMGKIGLAISIPATHGSMLLSSALFGWLILGERVSLRSTMALGFLMAALVLLGLSAEAARLSVKESATVTLPGTIALAVLMSGIAGIIFSFLSIATRHALNSNTSQSALVLLITGMGVITLGPLSVARFGIDSLLAISWQTYAWMFASGFFNLIGFLGLTKGLQLTTVVHANVLNASQVALAALAGMWLFGEPLNAWLMGGVAVTLLGILLIDRPQTASETVEVAV